MFTQTVVTRIGHPIIVRDTYIMKYKRFVQKFWIINVSSSKSRLETHGTNIKCSISGVDKRATREQSSPVQYLISSLMTH